MGNADNSIFHVRATRVSRASFWLLPWRVENRKDRSMTRHGWICSAAHTSGAGKMRNRVRRTMAGHTSI